MKIDISIAISLGLLLLMTIVYVLKSEARSDLDNLDIKIEVSNNDFLIS